jgi:uncharacterized delta-60 repeat protein
VGQGGVTGLSDPDGKALLGGTVYITPTGNTDFAVARLNTNGSLDTTFDVTGKRVIPFNAGGSNTDDASGIAVQADGKIVIVGTIAVGEVDTDFGVAPKKNPKRDDLWPRYCASERGVKAVAPARQLFTT